MLIDYSYCNKECSDMECKHNKKHLNNLYINGTQATIKPNTKVKTKQILK